ncbi:MAG: BON domain-containing protein [Hydrogenophaga sp.]|uniref:BON domain-containing protein n=1 Tax=Hydrogenophaga sp. TaxID=1904254 RepID=UPI001BC08234|nr:BON domain-containing protein [Hydrogenophaga sp.]MBS3911007.1 BON domain-containing protein [Hydrogenophaga sp.]MDO9149421.1 BON domain-containing protein [Hydrogenophaga sp.]MDO9602961.1 BON domain-containing protein [Hydrogenophaga sp.]MDP2166362.1 BON domain-containing protein [Hydrogenophaga sp.]MDP3475756.1 BON domain-containing protein [Hydrogenophaga sp.]
MSLKPNRWSRVAATTLTAVLLGAAVSACAPLIVGGAMTGALVATDRRTSGAQLEDKGIELRAANRLRERIGQRGNVSVTSYNRQVLLTGEVASEQDKALAETIVAGVENVRSIVNELGVLGASSLTQRSSDTLVTGRVKAAMIDARDLSASAVKVVTSRGTVYLMGRLTQREADRATEITRNTQGVQRVVRVLEIISEEELARLLPKPSQNEKAAPAK